MHKLKITVPVFRLVHDVKDINGNLIGEVRRALPWSDAMWRGRVTGGNWQYANTYQEAIGIVMHLWANQGIKDYTVILGDFYKEATVVFHVRGRDSSQAAENACREWWKLSRADWTEQQKIDDPFDTSNYYTIAVFKGHHQEC